MIRRGLIGSAAASRNPFTSLEVLARCGELASLIAKSSILLFGTRVTIVEYSGLNVVQSSLDGEDLVHGISVHVSLEHVLAGQDCDWQGMVGLSTPEEAAEASLSDNSIASFKS